MTSSTRRPRPPIRELANLFGIFHNVSYYAEELRVFQERGIERFWHGYMAYRSAPLGEVSAPTVTATFYNFAPTLVHEAVPAVWQHVSPSEAIQLRAAAMQSALRRAFPTSELDETAVKIADQTIEALIDQPVAGRALFGAYCDLPVPEDPILRLWHAATLWREYRGDGHNVALTAAEIDGIECHVLLAGKGIANQKIIEKIRGWDVASWNGAHQRLAARGLVHDDGTLTTAGVELRRDIETTTDQLAMAPLVRLGAAVQPLIEQLDPVVKQLLDSGIVPDRWPPPKLTLDTMS